MNQHVPRPDAHQRDELIKLLSAVQEHLDHATAHLTRVLRAPRNADPHYLMDQLIHVELHRREIHQDIHDAAAILQSLIGEPKPPKT